VANPASVTIKLKLSSSALKTREVRDGLREKMRTDVEGKLPRRAMNERPPQKKISTSPMRVLTSAKT
jgi:hypothetical protein